MSIDLVIKNGKIVTSQATYEGDDIAVKDGKIIAIDKQGNFIGAKEVIDIQGKYILPGLIDAHVHFREPGLTYKEDFATGSIAAAVGGITTVFDMPNCIPFTCTLETYKQKLEVIKDKAYVDYGLIAAVVSNSIHEIPKLAEAGINVFKIFMGTTVGGVPAPDDGEMLEAFRLVAKIGRRISVHAENNAIIDFFTAKIKEDDRTDALAYLEARPSVAEAEAIQRAILFAKETCCKLHICHISSKEGVELVKQAKVNRINVSAETTPHHLLLNSEHYKKLGSILKINPPIRSAENGEALWEGLKSGIVEVIATDHSPHTEEEKIKDNIWEAIPGFSGVETNVPLMLTQVNEGRISLNNYVKLASENPARLFNMYPQKGSFNIGTDADFTVIDMEKESVIDKNKIHSKSKITPFDGYKVKGLPVYTIVRGNIVMKNGKIMGKPQGRKIDPMV
jgi:dihydroorotase